MGEGVYFSSQFTIVILASEIFNPEQESISFQLPFLVKILISTLRVTLLLLPFISIYNVKISLPFVVPIESVDLKEFEFFLAQHGILDCDH